MSVLCPAEAGRTMDDHQDAARGSGRHAEGLPALRALAEFTPGPLADSSGIVGFRRGSSSGAWCIPNRQGFAPGVRQAQADGGVRPSQRAHGSNAGNFFGTGATAGSRLSECFIELEGPRGKIRIQWKGATAPDLAGLSRALWEGCLNVFGISAWHHVVGLLGVQRLADAAFQLFHGGVGTGRQLFPKL